MTQRREKPRCSNPLNANVYRRDFQNEKTADAAIKSEQKLSVLFLLILFAMLFSFKFHEMCCYL